MPSAFTPRAVPAHCTPATIEAGADGLPCDRWVRLSAAEQRTRFGGAPFGRRQIRRTARGFCVRQIVAYGQDWNDQDWSFTEVSALVRGGATVVGRKD